MKLTERGVASWNSTVYLSRAFEGRLDVGGREIRPIVKLHALAQVERVGLAVFGNFPAMRQVGDDGLAAVARIAPDQVVEHASLGADVADGARLMHVEMRRPIEDAVAQHATPLWIGVRSRHLKLRPIVLVRNISGEAVARGQTVSPQHRGGAAAKDVAAGPTGTRGMLGKHGVSILPLDFF